VPSSWASIGAGYESYGRVFRNVLCNIDNLPGLRKLLSAYIAVWHDAIFIHKLLGVCLYALFLV